MKAKNYKLGGDLLAGAAGIIGGAAGNIPIIGSMVEQGVYNLHDRVDNNLSDQEKQIRSGASAAGSIATGFAMGNPVGGVKNSMDSLYDLSQSFQFGGSPQQPQYEAEGGEVVDGGIPTAFNGGSISPNSSDSAKINGNSHEQGGVALKGGERVFSDTLKPSTALSKEIGYTGTTYAKIADKITKKIGKLEEASKSNDRFAKESAKRMIPTLQAKLDKVFENQEVTKQAALVKDYNKLQMKYGGKLPKLVDGGPTPPPTFEEWITRYPGLANDSKEAQMQSYNDFIAARGENYNYALDGTGGSIPTDEAGNPVNYPDINGTTMETQYGQSVPSYRPTAIVNSPMRQDFMANGTPNGDGTFSKFETTYPPTTETDVPKSTAEQVNNPTATPNAPATWQDALYKGAVYAPTIYNAVRGMQKPQVLNADEFQNPYEQKSLDLLKSRRYNIDPQLQSNRSSFNNLRENIKSASGGNSGSYLSNIQSSQINKDRADATAWATKNNFDNQYIGDEASAYGTFGAQRAATKLGIQDINDRNRAARNSFLGAATTGVSNIAQNEKHMSNLKANDAIRTKTLQYMNPDWGYTIDPTTGRPTGELEYKTITK